MEKVLVGTFSNYCTLHYSQTFLACLDRSAADSGKDNFMAENLRQNRLLSLQREIQ